MSHRNATDRLRVTGFNSYTDFPPQTLLQVLDLRARLRDYSLMKPLLSPLEDSNSLQTLGRASLQIVHDLKNQLNGLKLYATFLRKRMEKGSPPPDEMETVGKLIAGLDRAAADLSTLMDYGRPVELRPQAQIDLQKIMRAVAATFTEPTRATGALTGALVIEGEQSPLIGEFDPAALTEALKYISVGALKLSKRAEEKGMVRVSLAAQAPKSVLIEWQDVNGADHDPFQSFAGSVEIRMSVAAKIIEAHGGVATRDGSTLRVTLPLTH
jgi:signal transduction histidine kinase